MLAVSLSQVAEAGLMVRYVFAGSCVGMICRSRVVVRDVSVHSGVLCAMCLVPFVLSC